MASVLEVPARPIDRAADLTVAASWINLVASCLSYVATNPSRVYGLGVITEPLISEFGLSRTEFGMLNFWATLIVAGLSFGFGTFVDRLGIRRAYSVTLAALALSTFALAHARTEWQLFAGLTLSRIFGQGILALVSTALLGKSFPRGAPMAAAFFLLVTGALWGAVVLGMKYAFAAGWDWRAVWQLCAVAMAFVAIPAGLLLVREPRILPVSDDPAVGAETDQTARRAIRTPLFFVYGSYCFVSGVANSGIGLFFESFLKDRGFSRDVFFDALLIGIVGMVVFKFAIAWLCLRWSMGGMIAIAMLLSGAALSLVSYLETAADVYWWSILKALAYGIYVVAYFSIWGYAFGRRHLAQIQGAAHVITISASGVGPPIFGACRDSFGSYLPCIHACAALSVLLGIAMLFVRVPCAERSAPESEAAL